MNTTTTDSAQHDDLDPIDRILSQVDLTVEPPTTVELTATQRTMIENAAKTAYYSARLAGDTHAVAKEKAAEAAHALVAAPAVTSPATAPLESPPPTPAATNGSTSSSASFDVKEAAARQLDRWVERGVITPAGARANVVTHIEGETTKTNLDTHEQSVAQGVDVHGLARSEQDLAAARASGFAPKPTVWTRGLRVIQEGVQAARRSRVEYEEKPSVADMCTAIRGTIEAECRVDLVARGSTALMSPVDGKLSLLATKVGSTHLYRSNLSLTQGAFASLCSRLGYGGAQYLSDRCDAELRAHNVNTQHLRLYGAEQAAYDQWLAESGKGEGPFPRELVFRSRIAPDGGKEAFATVTPGYASFDVDQVAEAISDATPAGARGTVTYDGTRARFEVLFQSTVQPKHFVAGEFFRAGVLVRTDDTGGGAIRGSSVVWQNLCLNLAIIDAGAQDLFSLRHIGSVYELARKFRAEFKKALGTIDHFVKAWDYACEDDVIETARLISDDAVPAKASDALRGLFAGLLVGGQRARIKLPGRQIKDHVDALVTRWEADASSATQVLTVSRAAIVNAFTAYAHTVAFEDPFAEDEIQRQASALLWGRGAKPPRPLEYVDLNRASDAVEGGAS